jgi:aerotaxis receptor
MIVQNQEYKLNKETIIVSQTDEKGNIIYANDDFCKIAQYEKDELIGQPHNIVRHSDMPRGAFENIWKTIKVEKYGKVLLKIGLKMVVIIGLMQQFILINQLAN